MSVYDLKLIEENLKTTDVKNTIEVFLAGTLEDNFIQISGSKDLFNEFNPTGQEGELFVKENKILVGIGDIKDVDYDNELLLTPSNVINSMKPLAKLISRNYKEHKIKFADNDFIKNCIHGLIQSLYKFDKKFYSEGKIEIFPKILLDHVDNEIFKVSIAQCIARVLGDISSNYLTPKLFSEYIEKLFDGYNVQINILKEDDWKKENMYLFDSVARSSSDKGRFVTIKFFNRSNSTDHDIALVGKGITFDAGGISLKPSNKMGTMKCDMLGASTMLSTMLLAVQSDYKANITCTLPLAFNVPDGCATKPGDVIVGMNGKSVEILNTDAEGRLILGDALTYTQRKFGKPKYLIDAATLTGSIKAALGESFCGYFTNNNNFSDLIKESGKEANEFLHRMPLSKKYIKTMKSDVSDLRNTDETGLSGACCAAAFLYEFIDKDVNFVHFDIAGVSMSKTPSGIYNGIAKCRPLLAFYELVKKLVEKL